MTDKPAAEPNTTITDYLLRYLESSRGSGHTQCLVSAVNQIRDHACLVVVANAKDSSDLSIEYPHRTVTLADFIGHRLQGIRRPLLIDNHALGIILADNQRALSIERNRRINAEQNLLKTQRQLDMAKEELRETECKLRVAFYQSDLNQSKYESLKSALCARQSKSIWQRLYDLITGKTHFQ